MIRSIHSDLLLAGGAGLGALAALLGLLVFLGVLHLSPAPEMLSAEATITGKRVALAEAGIGKQVQAPEIRPMLSYRFTDAAGVAHSGEVVVSAVVYDAYAVPGSALLHYERANPARVVIGRPVPRPPQLVAGTALMALGTAAFALFANRLLKSRRGYGLL